jgi:hypothetical protein
MNILFIGLDYHDYTSGIIAEMSKIGDMVKYVDIQPRNIAFKTFRTAARSVYDAYLQSYHRAIIESCKDTEYDKVVFLQAHQMCPENISRLREAQKKAEFTLYNWDALSNHNYLPQAPFFDRVLTFDRCDAEQHGFGYLPLFCIRALQDLRRDRAEGGSVFTISNIVTQRRYDAVREFRSFCTQNGLDFRQHLKISPVVWAQLLRAGTPPTGVSLRSISPAALRSMVETSTGVFDFANHVQSGQTMRLMENLCAGKKIITNNSWVKREPFYTGDRIHVVEGLDFSGVPEFLNTPLLNGAATFEEYYVQNFTKRLLGLHPIGEKIAAQ